MWRLDNFVKAIEWRLYLALGLLLLDIMSGKDTVIGLGRLGRWVSLIHWKSLS